MTVASTSASLTGATPHRTPERIARYRVVRLIGEGGMGAVYEAEQEHPRRTVALKVIKAGSASPALLRRFEQEAEALGRLQHPGIAQIYEAGTSDTGFGPQPYFAMEFIRGLSLKNYAEAHRLRAHERLKIMEEVCEAVHHAHQRGLIHRDLKPSNILVDETGQPKILDFGVARVIDRDAQATSHTDVGQLIGTLAYMSPEQVLADPLELDTRSDVYALGVILYELLAGKLPYNIGNKLHQAVQAIREEDPARLSSVNQSYRGDIETIVAKALEKDKARRYASAAELAADIRRYLTDEPIVARRTSVSYQLQKFARRHKAVVGGAAAVFVVLIGGIIVSASLAARARKAEAVAIEQRNEAEAERNEAVQQKKRADTQAATAAAVSQFLQKDLFEQASSSQTGASADQSLRGALDRAAAKIQGNYDKDPLVEAGVREAIAEAYLGLLAAEEATPHLEQALAIRRKIQGEEDPDTLNTMLRLGTLYSGQKRAADGEALLRKVYDSRLRLSGEWNQKTTTALFALIGACRVAGNSAAAESLLAKADAMWGKRTEDGLRGASQDDVREVLAFGMELGTAHGINQAAARPIFNRTYDLSNRLLGPGDPLRLTAELLAGASKKQVKTMTDSLQSSLRDLDNTFMGALMQSDFRARSLIAGNHFDEAESVLKAGLDTAKRAGSDDNMFVASIRDSLGWLRLRAGKPSEAEAVLREAAPVLDRALPGSWEQFNNKSMLGAALEAQKKFAEAEPLLISGYEGLSSGKPGNATGRFTLDQAGEAVVTLYQDWGKPEKASEWRAALGVGSPRSSGSK